MLALALVEMIPVAAQTQVVTSDDLVYSMENSIELKNTGLVAAKPTKKLADGAMKLRVRDSKNKLICNSNWAVLNRESATSTWVEVRLTSANQLCR